MLYLQPKFRTQAAEVVNVINPEGKVLGYVLYLYKEGTDIFVTGHLNEIGEKQNYIDIVREYITGLKEACRVKDDPYVHIHCGGEVLDLKKNEEENDQSSS